MQHRQAVGCLQRAGNPGKSLRVSERATITPYFRDPAAKSLDTDIAPKRILAPESRRMALHVIESADPEQGERWAAVNGFDCRGANYHANAY